MAEKKSMATDESIVMRMHYRKVELMAAMIGAGWMNCVDVMALKMKSIGND